MARGGGEGVLPETAGGALVANLVPPPPGPWAATGDRGNGQCCLELTQGDGGPSFEKTAERLGDQRERRVRHECNAWPTDPRAAVLCSGGLGTDLRGGGGGGYPDFQIMRIPLFCVCESFASHRQKV